jgi:hypothetical protein
LSVFGAPRFWRLPLRTLRKRVVDHLPNSRVFGSFCEECGGRPELRLAPFAMVLNELDD